MIKHIIELLDFNKSLLSKMQVGIKRATKYAGYRLSCHTRNGCDYYKIIDQGKMSENGHYGGTIQTPAVQGTIVYNYLNRAIRQAEENIKYLEKALSHVKDIDPNHFKSTLPKAYQNIPPYIYSITGIPSIEEWLNKNRKFSTFHPEHKIFHTKGGWMVSSKSEVMIADAYHDAGLPYVYEELRNLNGKTVATDFTILHPTKYIEVPHEHFGMMDDPDYVANNFVPKMQLYSSAGYIPGVNFIVTFETKDQPLTPEVIQKIIKHFFSS